MLRNRSRGGRGLVHFSARAADWRLFVQKTQAENMDLSPSFPPRERLRYYDITDCVRSDRRSVVGRISLGVNMEFVRHADKSFEWGVAKAAELGYEYVEPMVHWGRELLSEAGYFHSVSMFDDPLARSQRLREGRHQALRAFGPFAVVQAGSRPGVSPPGGPFRRRLRRPVVNTDEGPKPDWTTVEEDHTLMRYVLTEAARVAERRGIVIGIEPHQQYSRTPDGLDRIYDLVRSPAIGINFDTGNSYLAGEDPLGWLARVRDRLVHLHAKDISIQQSEAERGKVAGTPVGCACGEGVIDWKAVIAICRALPRDIVFSVECGTVEQAAASIAYLETAARVKKAIGDQGLEA